MSVPAAADPNTPGQGVEAPSTGRTGATNAQENRADSTPASSAGEQEQAQRPPDYVRDAFMRLRGYTQTAAPAPQAQTNGHVASSEARAQPASPATAQEPERSAAPSGPATTLPARSDESQQRTPPAQAPSPSTPGGDGRISMTQDEYRRAVQSEVDRTLARQRHADATRAEQERERELRRTNPFEYANLMEQREQELEASKQETERLTGVVGRQLVFYDRAVLDTFVGALPQEERTKVISQSTDALENRKETAAATLKALRARWTAEARASAKDALMKDQTFIKEILARYGQAPQDSTPAPVTARPPQAATAATPNESVNTWMRNAARGLRSG